jgi:hypothetical protein
MEYLILAVRFRNAQRKLFSGFDKVFEPFRGFLVFAILPGNIRFYFTIPVITCCSNGTDYGVTFQRYLP